MLGLPPNTQPRKNEARPDEPSGQRGLPFLRNFRHQRRYIDLTKDTQFSDAWVLLAVLLLGFGLIVSNRFFTTAGILLPNFQGAILDRVIQNDREGFGEAMGLLKDVAVEVWDRIKMGASSAGAAATAMFYDLKADAATGMAGAIESVVGFGNAAANTFEGALLAVTPK